MNAPVIPPPSVPAPSVPAPCPKRTTDADRRIGHRIALLRRANRLSQGALGQALGLTFQQVQKYEKGANRVGAARLHDIAKVLGVPVASFFEPAADAPGAPVAIDCLAVTDAPELLRIFALIGSTTLRRHVLEHARATAHLDQRESSADASPQAEAV